MHDKYIRADNMFALQRFHAKARTSACDVTCNTSIPLTCK